MSSVTFSVLSLLTRVTFRPMPVTSEELAGTESRSSSPSVMSASTSRSVTELTVVCNSRVSPSTAIDTFLGVEISSVEFSVTSSVSSGAEISDAWATPISSTRSPTVEPVV